MDTVKGAKVIDVEGWPDVYYCYEDGRVYNSITNRFIKPTPNSSGYLMVGMSYKGKRKGKLLHRILAELFIENDDPENKTVVNHLDGDRQRNTLTNLEWTTPQGNVSHAIKMGLFKPWKKTEARITAGKKVGISRRKLSEDQVMEIKALYAAKVYNQRELAEKYNLARTAVCAIITGKTYKSIV